VGQISKKPVTMQGYFGEDLLCLLWLANAWLVLLLWYFGYQNFAFTVRSSVLFIMVPPLLVPPSLLRD